jgi:hypothetical protein
MKSTFIRSLLIAFGLFGSGLIIGVLIGSRRAAPPPTYIWDVALPIPQDWFVREERLPDAILRDYYFGKNPFPVLAVGRFYLNKNEIVTGLKQAISTYHQQPFECLGQQTIQLGRLTGILCQFRRHLTKEPRSRRGEALIIPLADGIVWVHWSVWEREYPEARPHYWNLLRKIHVGYLQHAPAGGSISFFIRQIVDGTFSKPMRYLSEVLSTW